MNIKALFSVILFITSFQLALAQCSRSGTFVQSDTAYSLSGTANVTFAVNGDKDVIFESDFLTVQGADLRVYLSKEDDILTPGADEIEITTSQLLNDNGGNSPPQSPITGMKTFPINALLYPNIQIEDFNYIVIQCISINERWGYANLAPSIGPNCVTLSTVENTFLDNISFYPNPVKNNLEVLNNSQLNLDIAILDIVGKEVLETNNISSKNQTVNLLSLKSGIHFIQIKSGNNVIVKKFLKE